MNKGSSIYSNISLFWSVFEKEDNTNGKVTGLKVLMKAYGKAKVVS